METDPQRPYRRRAIDNCHKIGFLCRAPVEAAGRRFMAPVNDEDFECEAAASGFAVTWSTCSCSSSAPLPLPKTQPRSTHRCSTLSRTATLGL